MTTEDQFKLFNDSFERCIVDKKFLDRFYEFFISSSDEIKGKFKSTDMEKQKEMLLASLAYIMYADKNPDPLYKIAQSHSKKNLNIKPELYINWMDSMIEAVKTTDPEFNEEVEAAWRDTLKPGIDFMTKNY